MARLRLLTRKLGRIGVRAPWLRMLLVATLLPLQPVAARAETSSCSREIRVSGRQVGRFLWATPAGEVVGPLRDFLTLIGRRAGCVFRYDQVSAARADALVGAGEIDILPGARTPERDRLGRFVPLLSNRLVLISRSDEHLRIGSAEALAASGVSIDVVRGYDFGPAYRALLAAMGRNGRVIEDVSLETIARRMAAGRSDATLIPAAPFVDAALAAGIAEQLEVTPLNGLPPVEGGVYLVERGLGPADADLLDRAIREGVGRGEFLDFYRRSVAGAAWGMTGVLTDAREPPP
jgi:polar amino acid transport system substrate-binding protein